MSHVILTLNSFTFEINGLTPHTRNLHQASFEALSTSLFKQVMELTLRSITAGLLINTVKEHKYLILPYQKILVARLGSWCRVAVTGFAK